MTSPEANRKNAAQGQYRTVETNWYKVADYIRFRYERALEQLPDDKTVVELGCGVGVGLAYLAANRPDLQFIGLELSAEAVSYGREHFGHLPNLQLRSFKTYEETVAAFPQGCFLVALEVLEHHNDEQLLMFKSKAMPRVDAAVFSVPYNQQNIEGTDHLQSFDIYSLFEIFPGFEVTFIRRHSIKFIGRWERRPRYYVRQVLGVAREKDAIASIFNFEGRFPG